MRVGPLVFGAALVALVPTRATAQPAAPAPAAKPTATATTEAAPPATTADVTAAAPSTAVDLTAAESGGTPLGSYERVALQQALSRTGLSIEPSPQGKVVRRILVVNLDVFGGQEGFLRWFNAFHATTRDYVIRREVLLRPGQLWNQDLVEETRRRLRDPLFTSLVVVAPVVAAGAPGQLDLLVITRDIWSLRMNSNYEVQETQLTRLSLSLSENNLLGLRKQVAFVFDMDQGAFSLGPQYVDKNMGGTHLALLAKWDALFNRETSHPEGSRSYTSFSYPLWSLEQDWGAGVVITHFSGTSRSFVGADLRTYDNPDTAEVEAVPWQYHERDIDSETTLVRQLGDRVKSRITLGHRLSVQRPSLLGDFTGDATTRAAFERDVLPRSERSSALFARYSLFTPTYTVYRDMDSYDLPEDAQLGPQFSAEVSSASTPIGSEVDFETGTVSGLWTFDIAGDGVARISAGASTRLQNGELIDNLVSANLAAASPRFLGMRLVGQALWARRYHETSNRFFTVGGDSGLRGYPVGAFAGQIRVLANLELRSPPYKVLFTRVGGLVFYDVGHAADCYAGCGDRLSLHQDVGLGLRMLVPQLQPYVFRFDYALPLDGPTAGLPGRFIAGVQQAF